MKKIVGILLIILFSLSGIFVFQYVKFYDGRLYIVFCNIGQGDAIYIRTPKGLDILVDGGPDDSVLSCLSSHMPFWDRDLELVILTHPHADHLNGLITISKHYKIISFATESLKNNTLGFATLTSLIKDQNVKVRYLYGGDRFKLGDGVDIGIVGPSAEFLTSTSPKGIIGENHEFANVESLIRYKKFSVLLTGDSQASELSEILHNVSDDKPLDVLQVPHHGSKTGLNPEILDFLQPKLAVISVGKHNKYGHPAPSTLDLLRRKDIKILRTDEDGEIEIVTDGESWGAK